MKRQEKDILELLGEILVIVLMIKPIFQLSIITGIGYIFAIVGSIYNGFLFKKGSFARYLLGGTLISYIAGTIFPMVWKEFKAENILSAAIMLILATYIWLKGYFLKKGIKI